MSSLSQFFRGTPGGYEQRFSGGPEQRNVYNQLTNAAQRPGAGGAYGDSADYYRNLLSGNPSQLQAMIAPDIRQFNQQTIPGLYEQFAGLGAGATSGSGFQNAALQAGTDLQERIAALRAQLQMQGAQGLSNIGQQSLGQYFTNSYTPRSPGLLEQFAPAIGQIGAAGLAGSTGGLSAILPFLMKLFQRQNNGIQDSISNSPATGPYGGSGVSYNPYTGVQ
jgi:hypothetical protein